MSFVAQNGNLKAWTPHTTPKAVMEMKTTTPRSVSVTTFQQLVL